MATAYLGLGTNLGDRRANLRTAVAALGRLGMVAAQSGVWETAPLYVTDQPAFLNMAVRLETTLAPLALLEALKALEAELGRVEGVRFGPRLIDLDILLHGAEVVDTPALVVPHPRLPERRFALAPLAELAGAMVHPLTGLSIVAMLERLPDAGEARAAGPL